jgi:hypothetical protein
MFEILETERIIESKAKITLAPQKSDLLTQLLVAQSRPDGDERPARIPKL